MSADIKSIVEQLLLLVSESEQYHGTSADKIHQDFHKTLGNVRQTLAEIHRRLLAAVKGDVIAFVGLTNVGKSTMLNAIFGQDLAPRRNGPCTAAPIEFVYGEKYQVTVHYFNHIKRPSCCYLDWEGVRKRLDELADSSGAEQSRTIKRVIVHAPLPILNNGLVIADTPGFGAAQLDDADGSHEEALKEYLTDSVSQVFWIVLGEHGILGGEKKFHDKFFGPLCYDIIITGCEDWDQRDKDRFRKRFSQVFEDRLPKFHFASGKLGKTAKENNDVETLEQSGIPAIEERIKSLANLEGRMESIEQSIEELAQDFHSWYADFLEKNNVRRYSFWRPDSFDRWTAACKENSLQKKLIEILTFQP